MRHRRQAMRERMEQMMPEERQRMRKRMRGMTPGEREEMRENLLRQRNEEEVAEPAETDE